MASSRADLEQRWLALTREQLPALAPKRGWPVRFDHCFQRILLDVACGRRWYDVIQRRPAFRHASNEVLARAVGLAEAVITGEADLTALNQLSLAWRAQAKGR